MSEDGARVGAALPRDAKIRVRRDQPKISLTRSTPVTKASTSSADEYT